MPGTRSSLTFLRGPPHGLAELLPLVSIMFVYTATSRSRSCGCHSQGRVQWGPTWPQGRSSYGGLDFPSRSSLLNRSLLFFLAGPMPQAVTATIVHSETHSSILMKQRTSSVHFNCQQVGNGRSVSLLTSYPTEQRVSTNESATVADKLNFKSAQQNDRELIERGSVSRPHGSFSPILTVIAADVT